METENINLLVTPVLSLSANKRYLYSLSDFAYGEWIIFQEGEPRFYLNIFDTKYDAVRTTIEAIPDMEEYLREKFALLQPALSIYGKVVGIKLRYKSVIKNFDLEKLPESFFASQTGTSKILSNIFDDDVIKGIIANNEFGITQVMSIEWLKSLFFMREEYPQIVELIKAGNLIELSQLADKVKEGTEYLEICNITDQTGRTFIVTVYDSDELLQDPQVVDIFSCSS